MHRLVVSALALELFACTRGGSPTTDSTSPRPAPPVPTAASTAALPASAEPVKVDCTPKGSGRDFLVGPGKPFKNIGDVPFESLNAGDTVRIAWRERPYREKMMIGAAGTEKDPVRVCGIPGPQGQLPVIDGQDATTRAELDFPYDGHQVRGVVIIGHPHGKPWKYMPAHIVLEGLEVRNGAPPYGFTDRSGKKLEYSNIAAGIFVERVNHLTIRGCRITANNNGLFTASSGDAVGLTQNLLIEANEIFGNGSVADYYEHNVYNEASNVIYQYNRFGSPRAGKNGVLGANIKERSAGVVIRYNWIEDGAHILDIVDAQEARDQTRTMPSFHSSYVYGNIIIRGTTPSGSMIHYGGDSGLFENYRKGTLFFYNNTVIVKNESYPSYIRTPVFELSTNDENLDSRNNVYFSSAVPDEYRPVGLLGVRDNVAQGTATFAGDWLKNGWSAHNIFPNSKVEIKAKIHGLDKLLRGDAPGFRAADADDYSLTSPSAVGAPVALPALPNELLPTSQYQNHQRQKPRTGPPTLGALGD